MMAFKWSLALGLCLSTALAHAEPAIDLWQTWQLALERDPIYAAQQAGTRATQEHINQARAQLLPAIDVVAGLEHNDTRRARGLNQNSDSGHNKWQVRLSQPLLDLNALALFERSKHVAAMAVLDQEIAKNQLALRVSQQYFNVLAAQDSLSSLRAQAAAIEQQYLAAQRAFELGGATITDSYEAQSRLDLLKAQIITAQSSVETAKQQLSRIIGQPVEVLAPLNPNADLTAPEPLNSDAWTAQASVSSIELAKAGLAVQAQQSLLKAQQREHAPTIALQAQSSNQSNQGIYGPSSGPRALDSRVGIELSIPLYSGGAISSKVRENTSLLQQRHLEHENARRQAVEQTQNHFTNVSAGLMQVKALEAAERSSLASVEANQTAYEVGVRINIDVLNAQQQLYETQRALAQARYQTLMQGLQLKSVTGQLQDDDIAAVSRLLIPAP